MFKVQENVKHGAGKGADKAPITKTVEGEHFVRFSHYEDDLRIDWTKRCLLPGTYTTTYLDAKYCLDEEIDPRVRYALPNALEVKYTFCIKPFVNTLIKKGLVEPANGQPATGVEVIFVQGTQRNTVSAAVDIKNSDQICQE